MHNPQFQAGTSLQSKWEEYEDPIIFEFIFKDEKDAFVRRINHEAQSVGGYDVYQSLMLSRIIGSILTVCAVKCATALLQGETGLKLDMDMFIPYKVVLRDIRCKCCIPLDSAVERC
ncbi:hypothetical protein V6N13_128513 [Hibiscus sabdariffa]